MEDNELKHIDKLFRQSLEGLSVPPPDNVWKKIRKKSGGKTWQHLKPYAILISAVVLIPAAIYLVKQQQATEKNPAISNKAVQTNTPKSDIRVTDSPANRASATNRAQISQGQSAGSSHVILRATTVSNTPEVASNEQDNRNIYSAKTQSFTSQPNKKTEIESKPVQEKAEETFSPDGITQTSVQPVISEVTSGVETAVLSDQSINTISESKTVQQQAAELGSETAGTPQNTGSGLVENADEIKPGENTNNNTGNVPSKPGLGLQFYTGVMAGYGRLVLSGYSPQSINLIHVLAGITNKNGRFSLETGVGLSRYFDQSDYRFSFNRTDTLGYTGYTLFNHWDSSYLFFYKPNLADTVLKYDTLTRSDYTYLRIPLLLNTRVYQKNKFSVCLSTGPVLEYLYNAKTTEPLNYPSEGVFVSRLGITPTRNKFNWQWTIAPALCFQNNKHFVFRLEPSIVFNLNPLYVKESGDKSKPYGTFLSGGIIYRF